MSKLSRIDEDTLKMLREKAAAGTISESEAVVRSVLEDRYNMFLEEGVQKLRQDKEGGAKRRVTMFLSKFGISAKESSKPQRQHSGLDSNNGEASPLSESDEESILTPVFPGCSHWSWICPDLIVGAVPHAGMTTDKAAHLLGLRDQLHRQKCSLAVVVSCLEVDELMQSPLTHEFAQPKDWDDQLRVTTFLHLPLPADHQMPIDLPFADALQVCSQVFAALHPRDGISSSEMSSAHYRPVAFIHCLAGNSRAWVLAMCYLTSQLVLSFAAADELLRRFRPEVNPSPAQVDYVNKFVQFCAMPIAEKRSSDEQNYHDILARILQMPPKYRQRLMKDLEKLT